MKTKFTITINHDKELNVHDIAGFITIVKLNVMQGFWLYEHNNGWVEVTQHKKKEKAVTQ